MDLQTEQAYQQRIAPDESGRQVQVRVDLVAISPTTPWLPRLMRLVWLMLIPLTPNHIGIRT
jgi:hypothetical protein